MPTRVLGIDPGIALMGYGLIEDSVDGFDTIEYGCLSTPATQAVELFVARNLKSALSVGQARGVAILAAAHRGLPVHEYTPLEVKQDVCGYGRGGKEQVQEMVRIHLGLDRIPAPDDAADALAVAICHIGRMNVSRLLAGSQ